MNDKGIANGTRVRITGWHYDPRLPIPSWGNITSFDGRMYGVYLHIPHKGSHIWYFGPDEVVEDDNNNQEMSESIKKELLEIISADKPAEHIILDLQDYLTN